MARVCQILLFAAVASFPLTACAQHHAAHHSLHFQTYGMYQGYEGGPVYLPQTFQPAPYYPIYPATVAMPMSMVTLSPVKAPAAGPSSAVARMKSVEQQAKGDRYMRDQKWSDAKAAYTSSVKSAPDRVGAHYRLALGYLAIRRFDSAISELKLALMLDPNLPETAPKFETIFGRDNKIAVTAIISRLGDWVGEDMRSSDRLFLLGAVLYFNNDSRARDAFEAALRAEKSGEAGHISAFLNRPHLLAQNQGEQMPADLPDLKSAPAVPASIPIDFDRRFPKSVAVAPTTPIPGAPVPMP